MIFIDDLRVETPPTKILKDVVPGELFLRQYVDSHMKVSADICMRLTNSVLGEPRAVVLKSPDKIVGSVLVLEKYGEVFLVRGHMELLDYTQD
jgi:hypothetical protein